MAYKRKILQTIFVLVLITALNFSAVCHNKNTFVYASTAYEAEKYLNLSESICNEEQIVEIDSLNENATEFIADVQQLLEDEAEPESTLIVKSDIYVEDDNAIKSVSGYNDLYIFKYETSDEALDACNRFNGTEGVIFAQTNNEIAIESKEIIENSDNESAKELELNNIMEDNSILSLSEEDSNLNWGISLMNMNMYNDFLENADYRSAEEIVVAIVDTGLNENCNEVFEGRVLEGKSFTYIDKKGFSFDDYFSNRLGSLSASYKDDNGHGTAVAGIVAQSTPDNVKILPIKCLDSQGTGSELAVYTGILHALDNNADVINLSCGTDEDSSLYNEIMDTAHKMGVTVVVAAGNEKQDVNNISPACIPSVITVSSMNENMKFSNFSNYGDKIDFVAPGENIAVIDYKGGYCTENGTSFSAPLISSVVAQLLCANPYFTAEEIYELLKLNCTDIGAEGWDDKFGYGWIDTTALFDDVAQYLFEVNGDADNNGEIDVTDALYILKTAAGETNMSYIEKARLGVYGENEVNSSHALSVMNMIVGKTKKFL